MSCFLASTDSSSCGQVRRLPSSVPIILLTARTEKADRIMGLDSGADDYLPKPFDPEELTARIRAVLRRSGKQIRQGAETLEVNGIKLSPGTREVWAGRSGTDRADDNRV